MSIEEFIAKFIEQEEIGVRQVVFGFLGYATLAVAGFVYVYKEYIGKDKPIRENVPDTTWLLVASFVFAAFACLLLILKFDGRKNFCTVWLPAKKADLKKDCIEKQNQRLNRCGRKPSKPLHRLFARPGQTPKDCCPVSDEQLINDFLADYYWFDMGRGFPGHIKTYLTEKYHMGISGCKPCKYIKFLEGMQNDWLSKIVTFFCVFLSIDFYQTAIRRHCLNLDAMWSLQALCHWFRKK